MPTFNASYAQTIRVVGGALPYTAVKVAGELPAGLTFNPATLLLSGTPVENGFSPEFAFTDANNETYRVTENLQVIGGGSTITIGTNRDLGNVAIGSPYSTQLFACCAGSYTYSIVNGTLPPGLSLSAGGLLSGMPATAGLYTFLIRAADAANAANYGQRQFTLRVVSGPLLRITTTSLPSGNVGSPYNQVLQATGGAGALTWMLAFGQYLPPGLSLAANGTISGTPAGTGQYTLTVAVADSAGQVVARPFIVSMYPAIEPARIEITSPVEPIYDLGSVVPAQYTCENAVTCTGSVPSGAALDTTTPGLHTLTVTATDAAGNTTEATARYGVSLGSCVAPFEGATAWLPGDGTAEDRITRTSAVWTGTPTYAMGRVGQAFAVSPGNSVSLALEQTGSLTLQAWVSTSNAMQQEGTAIVSAGAASPLSTSLQLELDGLGNYRLNVGNGGLLLFIGPARSIRDHVAATFDATTMLMTTYLNGQVVDQQTWIGSQPIFVQNVTLGVAPDGTHPFTGVIDEVQLFGRALSGSEVEQTFLAGSAGLCANRAPIALAAATPNPAEATEPAGAIVTLDGIGSSDPDQDTLTFTWVEETMPPTPLGTGSTRSVLFNLGSHTVTLTVDDGRGKTHSTSFLVEVRDTTPPALAIPGSVVGQATGPAGASVAYSASATDVVSGPVPMECMPASGAVFAIGVTEVHCSATDAAGNTATGTFNVVVEDTIPPVVQIASPSRDVLLSGASANIVLGATDVVGIVSVTVNGVAATMTSGTAQAGTWRATAPIALPVVPGAALRFDASASDASGNRGAVTLLVDNDGIPAMLDRDRASAADLSSVYSNDFNNGITAGTLTRNGWTATLANGATAGSIRAQISGAGSVARIGACAGAVKEVRLDTIGETADITCNPSTGSITVRALAARPWIDVWKQQSNNTWLVARVPTGATYQTGSPATASQDNKEPIDVRLVRVDGGTTTTVGGFRLAPGDSVDVSVAPGGGDEQVRFNVLRGRVAVTVSGRTRTLSKGDRATLAIDLTRPKIVPR